jgi:hypothetical protein
MIIKFLFTARPSYTYGQNGGGGGYGGGYGGGRPRMMAKASRGGGGPGGPGGPAGPGAGDAPEMMAASSSDSSVADASISVRKDFPETWIWQDILDSK